MDGTGVDQHRCLVTHRAPSVSTPITSPDSSDFSIAIRGLRVPEGTAFHWARGVYLAYNTNEFIRLMKGDWLMLMDDDHRFEPDFLERLLAHDKDVVVAHTTKKLPPYNSVLYKYKNGKYEHLKLEGKKGLVEVDACGKPGMLIKRHVLEAIDDPWCEYSHNEEGAEDFDFCGKIRAAGFKIHADLDLPLGHMAPLAVYKMRDPQGNWGSLLSLDPDHNVFLGDV